MSKYAKNLKKVSEDEELLGSTSTINNMQKDSDNISQDLRDNDYISELNEQTKQEFMSLGQEKANKAAFHYIQVFLYLEDDPEFAFAQANELINISSRLGSFREIYGIAAYHNEKFDIALKELKAARRINGSNDYVPIIADCYRGLGRPEKVIEIAKEPYIHTLSPETHAEMSIVLAGAFFDLGEHEKTQAILRHELTNKRISQSVSFKIMDASLHFYEEIGDTDHSNAYHEKLDPVRKDFEIDKNAATRYVALDLSERE